MIHSIPQRATTGIIPPIAHLISVLVHRPVTVWFGWKYATSMAVATIQRAVEKIGIRIKASIICLPAGCGGRRG